MLSDRQISFLENTKIVVVDPGYRAPDFFKETLDDVFSSEIRTATDAAGARAILASGFIPNVVISEVLLPAEPGHRLALDLAESKIPTVLVTSDTGIRSYFQNNGYPFVLQKPEFKQMDLVEAVHAAHIFGKDCHVRAARSQFSQEKFSDLKIMGVEMHGDPDFFDAAAAVLPRREPADRWVKTTLPQRHLGNLHPGLNGLMVKVQ